MKLGIVSDIHANLEAIDAVLTDMNLHKVDKKVCLGDIVGYGASPNECIETIISNFNYIVMGNHDEASIDLDRSLGFNLAAKEAIQWTAKQLAPDNKEYLRNLEYGYSTDEGLLFVHGSPNEPFDYIFSDREAQIAFQTAISDFEIAFVGHTHTPGMWFLEGKAKQQPIRYDKPDGEIGKLEFRIPEGTKAIINVGSVGQPRDYDTRASYVIYDTETRQGTFVRVPYSKDITIGKIKRAGLPYSLWHRLMYGQ